MYRVKQLCKQILRFMDKFVHLLGHGGGGGGGGGRRAKVNGGLLFLKQQFLSTVA